MSIEARNVAGKFVQGRSGNSPRTRIGVESIGGYTYSDYGSRILNNGERAYSYGEHFLIAERDAERGGFWLQEGKYQTGKWKSGKPKFSPTTQGHVREFEIAISRIADPTDETRLGWENMPRFVDPASVPMRFYRLRSID